MLKGPALAVALLVYPGLPFLSGWAIGSPITNPGSCTGFSLFGCAPYGAGVAVNAFFRTTGTQLKTDPGWQTATQGKERPADADEGWHLPGFGGDRRKQPETADRN